MKTRVYCLSLPLNHVRRAHFGAQAERLGLEFTYVDGLDAREVAPDQLLALGDQHTARIRFGRELGLAEVACAEGHRKIYRRFLETNDDLAVILEDDVVLATPFIMILEALEDVGYLFATSAAVVLLSGRVGFERDPLWVRRRSGQRLPEGHFLLKVVRSEGALYRGYGYLVTRRAAINILQNETKISVPGDHWEVFRKAGELEAIWILEPPVALHSRGREDSLLGPERRRIKAESQALAEAPVQKRTRIRRNLKRPWLLFRSIGNRLGWRRVKAAAYAWLSRFS